MFLSTSKDTKISSKITIQNSSYNIYENKVKISGTGNATWHNPKKPYKLKFDKNTSLLGMNENKDYRLLANYWDKSLIRTQLGFQVSKIINIGWTPDYKYVDFILNDEYLGNYMLVEAVKIGATKISVEEETGVLFEFDNSYYMFEENHFLSKNNFGYNFKFPSKNDGRMDIIEQKINQTEEYLINGYYNEAYKLIDITSFAKWYLCQNIMFNWDPNYFLYMQDNKQDTKIKMCVPWDFEWSLGLGNLYEWSGINFNSTNTRETFHILLNLYYFQWMINDNQFRNEIVKIFTNKKLELQTELLKSIDFYKKELKISSNLNFSRWNNIYLYNYYILDKTWEDEINWLQTYLLLHLDFLETEFSMFNN